MRQPREREEKFAKCTLLSKEIHDLLNTGMDVHTDYGLRLCKRCK